MQGSTVYCQSVVHPTPELVRLRVPNTGNTGDLFTVSRQTYNTIMLYRNVIIHVISGFDIMLYKEIYLVLPILVLDSTISQSKPIPNVSVNMCRYAERNILYGAVVPYSKIVQVVCINKVSMPGMS